jgi:hypothetical protein
MLLLSLSSPSWPSMMFTIVCRHCCLVALARALAGQSRGCPQEKVRASTREASLHPHAIWHAPASVPGKTVRTRTQTRPPPLSVPPHAPPPCNMSPPPPPALRHACRGRRIMIAGWHPPANMLWLTSQVSYSALELLSPLQPSRPRIAPPARPLSTSPPLPRFPCTSHSARFSVGTASRTTPLASRAVFESCVHDRI